MARDFHGHIFRHTCTDHIPDSASAKVMKNLTGNSGRFTGFLPGFVKLFDPISAIAIEENPGTKHPSLIEYLFAKLPLLLDDLHFFFIKISNPGVIVFSLTGFKSDDAEFAIDLIPVFDVRAYETQSRILLMDTPVLT